MLVPAKNVMAHTQDLQAHIPTHRSVSAGDSTAWPGALKRIGANHFRFWFAPTGSRRNHGVYKMTPTGDGSFYLYLHETVRNGSGPRVGDRVTVELSFDRDYRGGRAHPLPRWFSTALRSNRQAKTLLERAYPSRKKEILRYFASLKSSDAKLAT